MPLEPSFEDLLLRLSSGEDAAARELFHRFAGRLIPLARSHLNGRIRRKVDPEDVVLSAFKSFFRRQADGEFTLEGWDSLWGILSLITLRKCWRQVQYYSRRRRSLHREEPVAADGGSGAVTEAISREPTPEEAALLAEMVERLMHGLKEREQQMLQLRLQGYTVPEISKEVGRTEFTVEGVLKRLRKKLLKRLDSASDADA